MAKRVLIVDDAMIMRMRIREIAREAGWEIAGEATNGEEAVEKYRELRPDLVTLDIVMPRMDGVAALRRIREEFPDARIAMVSAVDQKEKLSECIRLGVIDFIVKPFDKMRLTSFFEKHGRDAVPAPAKSLFERLGGKDALDAAVGVFYQKVLADPRIGHFFRDVDMNQQIGKQRKFLAFAFGGPVNYDGRNLRDAHLHLPLTDEHFSAVIEHLRSALQQLKVPAALIDEVAAIAESTRKSVLNREG